MGQKYRDRAPVRGVGTLEEGEMYFGNANVEGECLTVEATKTSGLRVSMMRATCNLPSRPWKIIAYPYKGCNRSTDLKSVSNFTHSARMVELFRGLKRLVFQEVGGYSVQPKTGFGHLLRISWIFGERY